MNLKRTVSDEAVLFLTQSPLSSFRHLGQMFLPLNVVMSSAIWTGQKCNVSMDIVH